MSESVNFSDYALTYNDKGHAVFWTLQHEVTKNILGTGMSRTIDDMVADVTLLFAAAR